MIDGNLRYLFSSHLSDAHWQAIETGTGRGIPDSNYCFPGGAEGWVEYKATGGWRVIIRPEQLAWAERRLRAGGRVHLAVRRACQAGPRRTRADELWLFRGEAIRSLKDGRIDQVAANLLVCRGFDGPARWPWGEVMAALTA